ncbi:hypothetical protein LJ737_04930 [Hymenobacter sp. 15J16-1T3B]|uniref:hypothetical protein n=1 Tax=Hymenobacter sp. 15J16-1T3B TaxID=2886941 RepID=UPI001D0F8EC7|nr:hypothetical protein [Hymenobacter sp. 15J16-1T3B]MCC3156570.1 hypothetical protein [Hymenobacter sp. 15J16-1T3B]
MSQRPTSSRPLWFWLALPFGIYALFNVLGGLLYALAVMGEHISRAGEREILACTSAAEARAAGVLLDTVLVTPRRAQYGRYTIEFTEGWLEELRETERPVWYAARTTRRADRVRLRVHYRVRRQGPPPAEPWDVPLLRYGQDYGATPIDQEVPVEVDAPRLRPDYYQLPLPLELRIDDGPGGLPDQVFVACPAQQCRTSGPAAPVKAGRAR